MELTTSRAIELFLASLRTRSAPPNTIKAYRLDLQQFLKQAPEDLSEVTADIIRVFLDSTWAADFGTGLASPVDLRCYPTASSAETAILGRVTRQEELFLFAPLRRDF